MNKAHKQTAWKKNREFGDKMGGRCRLKLDDNIFAREHSFRAPTESDEIPIFIVDNTSRDYYFPVSVEEIREAIKDIPHSDGVTHIWLRKHVNHNKKKDLWIEEITGSGVRLITLYPIMKDNRQFLGKEKRSDKDARWFSPYAELVEKQEGYYAVFTEESAKKYYLERLIPYGIEALSKMK